MNQESIVQKNYEFLLYMLPQLSKFPRNQKFLLADRMQTKIMDLQDAYIKAYYAVRKEKGDILRECNLGLEQLRYLVRLSHDLKYFETERYGIISKKINEIGKMTGAWIKSVAE